MGGQVQGITLQCLYYKTFVRARHVLSLQITNQPTNLILYPSVRISAEIGFRGWGTEFIEFVEFLARQSR